MWADACLLRRPPGKLSTQADPCEARRAAVGPSSLRRTNARTLHREWDGSYFTCGGDGSPGLRRARVVPWRNRSNVTLELTPRAGCQPPGPKPADAPPRRRGAEPREEDRHPRGRHEWRDGPRFGAPARTRSRWLGGRAVRQRMAHVGLRA